MIISDLTLETLRAGLSGLNARRQAGEDAVSNMETPGYLAKRVAFEDQLSDAIDSGDPMSARMQFSTTGDAPLPNGNNVRVDQEMIGLTETGLRQQLLVEAANSKFRLLRTVIGT